MGDFKKSERGNIMLQMKLCDLVACLKPGITIEFDLSSYEKKMYFTGSINEFLKSIHYHAFMTDNVAVFYISGNFFEGYTAHIRMLPNDID